MSRGIYFSSKSGGPCWSRDRGYHKPDPLPRHIMDIVTAPAPKKRKKSEPCKACGGTGLVNAGDDVLTSGMCR